VRSEELTTLHSPLQTLQRSDNETTNEVYTMKMLKDKGGKLNTNTLSSAITAIVLLVVLFKLYASLVPEAQTAGDELNAAGVPLGSLFTSSGVVFVIIMAALIIAVVLAFMPSKK